MLSPLSITIFLCLILSITKSDLIRQHIQLCDHLNGNAEHAKQCCQQYGFETGEFIEQSGAVFCSKNETISDLGNKLEKAMDEIKVKYEKKLKMYEKNITKCAEDGKKNVESMRKIESESKSVFEKLLAKITKENN